MRIHEIIKLFDYKIFKDKSLNLSDYVRFVRSKKSLMQRITTLLIYGFILLIAVHCISCKSEIGTHIPEKSPDLKQGTYDKYSGLLQNANETGNSFEAAIQLANLKADKKITYATLKKAIKDNPEHCDQLFEWYWLYDRHNFRMNILKLDTTLFKETVALCNELKGNTAYEDYAAMKDQEEEDAIANREKEDSTNFDLVLVKELEEINKVDQEVRIRLTAKTVTPKEYKEIQKEMQIIDSINMQKIETIFEKHGYPSRELVGKECNFTPALVIHHSNSLATRYKHLPFLEKAVEEGVLYEGTLDMIKRRISDMELNLDPAIR